jgi:hypothetical protein
MENIDCNIYFLVKSSLVNKAIVLMVIKKETPIATTTRAKEKTGSHHQGTNNLSIKNILISSIPQLINFSFDQQ